MRPWREQPLQGEFSPGVAPPRTGAFAGILEARHTRRAPVADLFVHLLDVTGILCRQLLDAPPRPERFHAPAEQSVLVRWDQRSHVPPVFEDLAAAYGESIQRVRAVRTDPGEHGKVVAARDDVHRIQLQQTDVVHDPTKVPHVDPSLGSRATEALRADCDAPGSVEREASHSVSRIRGRATLGGC